MAKKLPEILGPALSEYKEYLAKKAAAEADSKTQVKTYERAEMGKELAQLAQDILNWSIHNTRDTLSSEEEKFINDLEADEIKAVKDAVVFAMVQRKPDAPAFSATFAALCGVLYVEYDQIKAIINGYYTKYQKQR